MDVAALLADVGLDPSLADRVTITGADPIYPTPFPLGELAAAAAAAGGAVVASWNDVPEQEVAVDVGAAAASLLGFALQKVDGGPPPARPAAGDPLVALHECRDGRWIHLHGSFPALKERTRKVIGAGDDVAALVRRWDAQSLEDALAEAGTCGAMVRTPEEWLAHPQHASIAPLGRVSVTRVGDSPPKAHGAMRVLDLTRVLAGPTCGRTLASYGADVLLLNGPSMPNVEAFVLDTSHGKRSAFLTLPDQAHVLRRLVDGCDVFAQGYRSGAMERQGFGVDDVVAMRPGVVYVTINCYGDAGPWRERPGWEQLAQSATGIASVQGSDGRPQLLPAAACDYTTGYLAAFGVLAALARRAVEGGSWHVQASLCQTAEWMLDEGPRCDPAAAAGLPDTGPLSTTTGNITHLRPIVSLSHTPTGWSRPSPRLGADAPEWLPV